MKLTIFLTLVTLVLGRYNYQEEKLARRPRDLLYWNRLYNNIQTVSKTKLHDENKIERRPPTTFMCKAMLHLLKRATTRREQTKLRITMLKNGCEKSQPLWLILLEH